MFVAISCLWIMEQGRYLVAKFTTKVDLDFARVYDLSVKPVVLPKDENPDIFKIADEAWTGDGIMFNSDFLNGLSQCKQNKRLFQSWLS